MRRETAGALGASDPIIALNTKLLHVDKIKQILVLERPDDAKSLLALGQSGKVVIRSFALVTEIIGLDRAFESFGAQMLIGALVDIKQALIEGLCARQNQTMTRKTD